MESAKWLSELLVLVCALTLTSTLVYWRFGRMRRSTSSSRPMLLAGTRLVYAEQLFRCAITEGWILSARVDRAYEDLSEQLILVELKTRFADMVYLSDIVELSAQRFAIESGEGRRVSEQALVLVKSHRYSDGRFHQVVLMPQEAIVALAVRRERLLIGMDVPKFSSSLRLCSQCGFRFECPKPDM